MKVCKKALNSTMKKFDPEEHKGLVYEAFDEFVDEFQYEYDAIAKDLPKELESNDIQEEWIQQNKPKIFLGRFSSRNLQKKYEEVVPELQRAKISFNDMIKRLKTRFKAASNTALANFEFHKIHQHEEESFDAFTVKVKHEANHCDFTSDNPDCSVKDTLVYDQNF